MSTPADPPLHAQARPSAVVPLAQAVGAYLIWGFLPLYFYQLRSVSPLEVIAHRILWSVVLLIGLLAARRQLGEMRQTLAQWARLRPLILSALLIAINWLVYIWAVTNGHTIAASLGYFLNPLVNVVLGRMILHERLSRIQWMAVALAGMAVATLAAGAIDTLWISLTLALSFGTYGLIRKVTHSGPLVGLAVETIILMPMAAVFLGWWAMHGHMAFATQGPVISIWLMLAGVITCVPLLLFAAAARQLQYTTMGLLQYIGPSIQMLIALFVFHEPLQQAHRIAFPLIWSALIIYSIDAFRHHQASKTIA